MLAWVGRMLPYSNQVENHFNHTPRAALPFLSINSFIHYKDGLEMDIMGIHGMTIAEHFT